jgi:hypothetical protein
MLCGNTNGAVSFATGGGTGGYARATSGETDATVANLTMVGAGIYSVTVPDVK